MCIYSKAYPISCQTSWTFICEFPLKYFLNCKFGVIVVQVNDVYATVHEPNKSKAVITQAWSIKLSSLFGPGTEWEN